MFPITSRLSDAASGGSARKDLTGRRRRRGDEGGGDGEDSDSLFHGGRIRGPGPRYVSRAPNSG